MSIKGEIDRIADNIALSYDAVKEKGGTLPSEQNSANLPDAIRGIQTGALLESIRIAETPTKSKYSQGDCLDPSGLIVQAVYTNGAKREVTDYTLNTGSPNYLLLGIGMQRVQVAYTEFGIKKTVEFRVEVTPNVPVVPDTP